MQVPAKLAIAGGVGVAAGLATTLVPGDRPPVATSLLLGTAGVGTVAANSYFATRATPTSSLGLSMYGVSLGATLATMGVVNLFRHDAQ